MKIDVRNNDVAQAYKVLRKKLQREGIMQEMRKTEAYEKPSDARRRAQAEAVRRNRKALKRRQEKLGY